MYGIKFETNFIVTIDEEFNQNNNNFNKLNGKVHVAGWRVQQHSVINNKVKFFNKTKNAIFNFYLKNEYKMANFSLETKILIYNSPKLLLN